MAEFAAVVYQNEFLPEGGTDVNAIVTVTCTGCAVGSGPYRLGRRRRDHHRRHLGLDGSYADGGGQAGGRRRARPDRRRDLVRGGGRARTRPTSPTRPYGPAPGMVVMDANRRFQAHQAVQQFRADGGTAMGTVADAGRAPLRLGRRAVGRRADQTPRDPAHRRREPQRDARPAERGHRVGRGPLPVRLPRRRRRLAGRRGAADRAGAAGHGRHRRRARASCSAEFASLMQAVDGARGRGRRPAGLDAAGRAAAVRPPGVAVGRGPHDPPHRRQRAHRRVPDGLVGRRVARLPRRPSGCPPSRSARSSSPPASSSPSGRTSSPSRWSRPAGPTTRA